MDNGLNSEQFNGYHTIFIDVTFLYFILFEYLRKE